jgi:hypothetical protein
MSKPLAICIEELGSSESKYTRCVALPGRQPGLRLNNLGQVLWQSDDGVSCELWVSADERLILYRPESATGVTLRRAGRSLDVPYSKPVVVIDQDEIDVGTRRMRIHIHGEAPSVAAPSPLPARSRTLRQLAQMLATTAVMGAAIAASGCAEQPMSTPTIEVRLAPPEPTAAPALPVGKFSVEQAIQGAWTVSQAYLAAGEQTWITGTLTIEDNSYTFKPAGQAKIPSVRGTLDFLYDTPHGQVTISYLGTITPRDALESFAAGDALALCEFRTESGTLGTFLIRVQDSKDLYFESSEDSLWSVKKQLGADNQP